jgi:hypothetical protein
MEKYINELLKKNNRLIIPDFGAFIQKQDEPNAFVFNEFLRYNDGLLADYVANAENIDRDKANDKIATFVKEVVNTIDASKPYSLGMLGSLIKDKNKKVLLVTGEQATTESKEVEKITNDGNKGLKKETTKNGTAKSKVVAAESNAEEKVVIQPVNPNLPKDEPVKNTEVKPEAQTTTTIREPEKADKTPLKSGTSVKSTASSQTHAISYKKQKQTNYTFVWVIVIIVLLGAAITLAILNKDHIPVLAKLFGKKQTEQIVIGASTDTIAAKPVTETEQPVVVASKKYYIVAGCFEIEANADKYVKKLQGKGYNASKFGKYKNLYTVSFESYNSWNEALMGLKEIRTNVQSEAWILYY